MNRFTFMLQYEALKDLYKYVSTAEKLAVMEFYGHSIHQCSIAIAMSLNWLEEQGIIAIEGPLSNSLKNQGLLKIFNKDTLDKMLKTVELSNAFCMEYREPDIEELSESMNALEESCHCLVECLSTQETKLDSLTMDNKEIEPHGEEEILSTREAYAEKQSIFSEEENINDAELFEEKLDVNITANCNNMDLVNIEEESKISSEGSINALSKDKAIEKERIANPNMSGLELDNLFDIECIEQQSTQYYDNIKGDINKVVGLEAVNTAVECEIPEIIEASRKDNYKKEASVDITKIDTNDNVEVIGQKSNKVVDVIPNNDRVEEVVADEIVEQEDINNAELISENDIRQNYVDENTEEKGNISDVELVSENSISQEETTGENITDLENINNFESKLGDSTELRENVDLNEDNNFENIDKDVEEKPKELSLSDDVVINKENMLTAEPFWQILAENGDVEAMNNLGDICYFYRENRKKYVDAADWYSKAAEQGDCYGLLQLKKSNDKIKNSLDRDENLESNNIVKSYIKLRSEGLYYSNNTSVWSCFKEELGLNATELDKLVALGDSLIVKHSNRLTSYIKNIMKYYKLLAKSGDVEKQIILGDIFFYGIGVKQDYHNAMNWYKRAKVLGNIDGLRKYKLIFMLGDKDYVEYRKSVEKSKIIWEKLAQNGDTESANNLGDYYFYLNEDRDQCKESIYWYDKAVSQEDCYALLKMSLFYKKGILVEKSIEKVKELQMRFLTQYLKIKKLVVDKKTDIPSIGKISDVLKSGKDSFEDIQELYLYQASQHTGYIKSILPSILQENMKADIQYNKDQQFLFGEYNYLGIGLNNKDIEEGFRWYEKAAGQGQLDAQQRLIDCYLNDENRHKFIEKAIKYYKQLADAELPDAQYMLGKCYEIRTKDDIEYREALALYEKAANKGNEPAINAIAGIVEKWCLKGYEALKNKDYRKAIKFYRLGVEKGSSEACDKLAECFYNKPNLAQDKEEMMLLYKKAAKHGNVKFQYYLGEYYHNSKNYYRALEWYELSTDQNYMDSLEKALECCIEQENINQPVGDAWKFYKKGAEAGIPWAMYRWALCCEKGIGVGVDIHEALKWHEKALSLGESGSKKNIESLIEKIRYEELLVKAVDEGEANAQYQIGLCYEQGRGIEADTSEAIEYYSLAADQGYVMALMKLGDIYEKGELVQKNLKKAVDLYKLAAKQDKNTAEKQLKLCEAKLKFETLREKVRKEGVPEDLFQLALCYEYGNGIGKNMAKAIAYYKELAEKGLLEAQYKLGVIYKTGNGVDSSIITALEYFYKVAKRDLNLVKDQVEKIFRIWSHEYDKDNFKYVYVKYVYWLKKFSEFNLTYVKFRLGRVYFEFKKEYNRAFQLFLDSSSTGYSGPLSYLAYCYEHGLGTEVDYAKAVKIYMNLVHQGSDFADERLSICYPKLQILHECDEVLKKGNMYELYDLARICEGMDSHYKNKDYAVLLYEKAVEYGYRKAQFRLGVIYERGKSVERNLGKALNLFNAAYDKGVEEALDFIEICQQEMYFMEMLKKCKEEECPKNLYALGLCYENGNGVNKDNAKAFEYYKQAADLGLGKALYKLGLCYENGIGTPADEECALDSYIEAISKGVDTAKTDKNRILETLFEKGVKACKFFGGDGGYIVGKRYLMKAAENGHVQAQSALGSFYATGLYWGKNIEEAVKWLEKAYAQGSDDAAIILGSYYMTGTGVVKDKVKGIEMVKSAADNGLPYAQDYLGNCYFHGDGVPKDYMKAFAWHMKAAEKGFAEAQNNVGGCYSMGYGVEKDLKEAFYWNMKSANQNFAEAQYAVGLSYLYGNGVERDLEKANYWLLRAARNGHEGAKMKLMF